MQEVTGETRKGILVGVGGREWGGRYGQDTLYLCINFSMSKQK